MSSSPSLAPPSVWQEQRSAIRLDDAGTAGPSSDLPPHLRLVNHIGALLPPFYLPPADDWCAAILNRDGAHRCWLLPHGELGCAVSVVLLRSDTHGRLALITVREAAQALSDGHWRAAERLETTISTASTMVHKLNNTLTSLLGHAEHLADMEGLPPAAVKSAQQIMVAVEKLEQLSRRITQLRAAVRPQVGQCDPSRQLTRLAERLRRSLPPGIVLKVDAPAGQGLLLVAPQRLDQAIEELVGNAVYALRGGGQVSLAVTPQHGIAWPGFAWVGISVTDNGPGITDEALAGPAVGILGQVGRGNTLSLGLAIAHAFAQGLGGYLSVERPTHGGTRITFHLPVLSSIEAVHPLSQH